MVGEYVSFPPSPYFPLFPEDLSEADKAKSEIIIAKQRNGPTDTVYLNFIAKYTRFDNQDAVHDV
jgi:replicative DNA helicase